MSASKFQQLSDAFLKISQGFAEVASIMNTNIEPVEMIFDSQDNKMVKDAENNATADTANDTPTNFSAVAQQPPTKKVKKERDPNQPKKPLNNYFLFQRDFRARFKESNPNASSAELTKAMNETWEKLSKEEAEYYDNLAKEHYAAYMKALNEYKNKDKINEKENEKNNENENENENESNDNLNTPVTPVIQDDFITPTATPVQSPSETDTPKKKKKKNKEKRDKHSQ